MTGDISEKIDFNHIKD